MLEQRDYKFIIDKSGSMKDKDMPGGRRRWDACQEGVLALAAKIEEFDPDGMTVYAFSDKFKRYDNVKADTVERIFKENEPNGGTNLDGVLKDALDDFARNKKAGKLKENGELIVVVTDGVPNDQKAVERVIIEATKGLDKDEELAILFLQIGKDPSATKYLQSLDDDLVSRGAKFDIVDVTTCEDASDMTFVELLTKAISD